MGRIGKRVDIKSDCKINSNHVDDTKKEKKEMSKLEELQEKLKEAIKEERYEEAAKIRDEIKKLEE